MASTTYIVTVEDFKTRANISANILTDRFKQESGIEQEIFGKKILCIDFYNEILLQIETYTLSTANEALLPYLKDYLVFKIYSSYLVDGNIIVTPSGFRTQVDSTSSLPTDKQMAEVERKADRRAKYYQDQLVNFLTSNATDYPLWKDSQCSCNSNIRPVKENRFSKIGKSKGYTKIEWT